jgi:hypothetical protein
MTKKAWFALIMAALAATAALFFGLQGSGDAVCSNTSGFL